MVVHDLMLKLAVLQVVLLISIKQTGKIYFIDNKLIHLLTMLPILTRITGVSFCTKRNGLDRF